MQVVKESLPTRCEICHKSDFFYPDKQECLRCKTLGTISEKKEITFFGKEKESLRVSISLGFNYGIVINNLVTTTIYLTTQHRDLDNIFQGCYAVLFITFICFGIIVSLKLNNIKSVSQRLLVRKVNLITIFAQLGFVIAFFNRQGYSPDPSKELIGLLVGALLGFLLSKTKLLMKA